MLLCLQFDCYKDLRLDLRGLRDWLKEIAEIKLLSLQLGCYIYSGLDLRY